MEFFTLVTHLYKQYAFISANLDDQKKLKRDLAFYNSKEKVVSDKSKELKPSTSDIDKSHYEALCRGHVTRVITLVPQ
jgi:hypothetical protein